MSDEIRPDWDPRSENVLREVPGRQGFFNQFFAERETA